MNNLLKTLSGWFDRKPQAHRHSSLPSSRNSQISMLHDGSETATRGQLVQVLLRDLVRKSGMPPGLVQCQIQVVNSRSRGNGIYVRLVIRQWDERLMKYAFAFQKALLTDIVQFEPQAGNWLRGIAWQLEVAGSCPLTELPGPDFWQAPAVTSEPLDQFDIIPMPAHPAVAAVTGSATQTTAVVSVTAPGLREPPVTAVVAPAVAPSIAPAMAPATAPAVLTPLAALPSQIEVPATPVDDTAQDLERLFAIRDNELANLAKDNFLPAGYDRTEPSPLDKR